MRRVAKRIEQDEKYLSLCSHLKFKYFNFCEIFLKRKQSDFFLESRGHFTRSKKFSQNGRPTVLSGLREDRPQYILKTRIIELAAVFRWDSKKVEINFSTEIFFSNEKIASAIGERREWKSGFTKRLKGLAVEMYGMKRLLN